MRRNHLGALLVVALVVSAAACSSSSTTSSTNTGATTSTSSSSTGAGASSATIVASGFAFDPSSVDLKAGKVTLTVTNEDSTLHTFTLDDGSSSTDLQPGKTETITLNLTKTVGFHCTIHTSMTGTLNVVG